MADPEMDDDLFADLYDGEADDPPPPSATAPTKTQDDDVFDDEIASAPTVTAMPDENTAFAPSAAESMQDVQNGHQQQEDDDYDRPIAIKEDGKMFIGGLNWETTDQSLKDYFSQFGEVIECTVMRDGATGRSRGFGFLTFKDPKTVNIVMVKEHQLDGKLIDPKRAIPREEQERTAKIFVGGVSQECTESEFKEFFMDFGRVLDATLMMDKNTGRPRGFGFVTFDSEAAVDRTLEHPLAIHNKMVEIKRAEPRGNLRDDDAHGKFGRHNKGGNFNNFNNNNNNNSSQQDNQMNQNGQNAGGQNNMTPAMMAQYWQRMHQYFQMMQQQMAANNMQGMNPAMMQNNPMMQQMMARQGMNPAMMQQMASMQGGGGNGNGGGGGGGSAGGFPGMGPSPGSPMNGPAATQSNFNAQDQMMFEQQKFERQQAVRMQQGNFQSGNVWDGMYDDVPAPTGMQGGNGNGGGMRGGGFVGRGGRGGSRNSQGHSPAPGPAAQAPINAPTGPKNAGIPGANYRGGGRGNRRGFHPYARGGGAGAAG